MPTNLQSIISYIHAGSVLVLFGMHPFSTTDVQELQALVHHQPSPSLLNESTERRRSRDSSLLTPNQPDTCPLPQRKNPHQEATSHQGGMTASGGGAAGEYAALNPLSAEYECMYAFPRPFPGGGAEGCGEGMSKAKSADVSTTQEETAGQYSNIQWIVAMFYYSINHHDIIMEPIILF